MEAPLNLKVKASNRDPIDASNDFPIDLTTPHTKVVRRRSSFFNLEKPESREKRKEEEELQKQKEYIDRLNKERDGWAKAVADEVAKTRELKKQKKTVHDSSILSQERRDFLAGSVDISKFVDTTEALADSVFFLAKELEWKDKQIAFNEKMLEERIADSIPSPSVIC